MRSTSLRRYSSRRPATKQTLLSAKSISYADPAKGGLSGVDVEGSNEAARFHDRSGICGRAAGSMPRSADDTDHRIPFHPFPDEAAIHTNAFRSGLEETGYMERSSIVIEYRSPVIGPAVKLKRRRPDRHQTWHVVCTSSWQRCRAS